MTESDRPQPPTDLAPTAIERDDQRGILIRWNDDTSTHWTIADLRKACPCATCREKRRSEDGPQKPAAKLPVLSAAEARPLDIQSMNPVGSYAYMIAFSDGHSSGIYPFAMLYTKETNSSSHKSPAP